MTADTDSTANWARHLTAALAGHTTDPFPPGWATPLGELSWARRWAVTLRALLAYRDPDPALLPTTEAISLAAILARIAHAKGEIPPLLDDAEPPAAYRLRALAAAQAAEARQRRPQVPPVTVTADQAKADARAATGSDNVTDLELPG